MSFHALETKFYYIVPEILNLYCASCSFHQRRVQAKENVIFREIFFSCCQFQVLAYILLSLEFLFLVWFLFLVHVVALCIHGGTNAVVHTLHFTSFPHPRSLNSVSSFTWQMVGRGAVVVVLMPQLNIQFISLLNTHLSFSFGQFTNI